MKPLRARQGAGIGVGAGNAQPDLDMEVGIGAGAAQVQDYGFGETGEFHHGVAREMGRARCEIKQMAVAGAWRVRSALFARRQETAVDERLGNRPGRAGRAGERNGGGIAAPKIDPGDGAIAGPGKADPPDAALRRLARAARGGAPGLAQQPPERLDLALGEWKHGTALARCVLVRDSMFGPRVRFGHVGRDNPRLGRQGGVLRASGR